MKKQNFNRDWTVKKISINLVEDTIGNGSASEEKKVTLPYDAMVFEQREAKNPAGGACGFYPGGDYEYTKVFFVEKDESDETFLLEFEGIYNRGYIYVNGALAGSVHYGYTRLFVDITPYLNFGMENIIKVKVINSDVPNSRWYTGSGIYRPVYLYKGGKIRIDVNGLKISTPEISDELAAIKVETKIKYDEKIRKKIAVKTEIIASNGSVVAEECSEVSLFEQSETIQTQRIYVKNPTLWSVDSPNLYSCKVEIKDENGRVDTAESTFGIRKLEMNPVEGLKINGETVLLRGGCIHHDNGPVGAATFERAEERRVKLLKEAGFNSIRISHNSSSKAMLDACDKLGMLVMEESFDTWTQAKSQFDVSLVFAENWEKDLKDIVEKDFNHPSVFMYSIGNEITDLGTTEGAKWSRKLAEKMRELDTTRYVTNAVNGLLNVMEDLSKIMLDLGIMTIEEIQAIEETKEDADEVGINDIMTKLLGQMNLLATHPEVEKRLKEAYGTLDLIGLNYMRGAYEQMEKYPNRVFYGSETLPPDIDLNWEKVKSIPACIGDYTWTAWDYIGEAGVGVVTYDDQLTFSKPYPTYLAYCGDIDITGYRRPLSFYREIVFGLRKIPYIAVQLPMYYGKQALCTPWTTAETVSSWTWNGFEGKGCKVEVYSDAPEVELFINGESAGRLPTGKENRYRAIYNVTYQPGEVKAVSYYADGTVAEHMLKTADDNVSIFLDVDRTEIKTDDIAYVAIELKDAKGVLNTDVEKKVKVTVEGAGVLQGLGSADPLSEENFFDTERTTFYGRAVAVVRAGAESGSIKVCVEADDMEAAYVEINVK